MAQNVIAVVKLFLSADNSYVMCNGTIEAWTWHMAKTQHKSRLSAFLK